MSNDSQNVEPPAVAPGTTACLGCGRPVPRNGLVCPHCAAATRERTYHRNPWREFGIMAVIVLVLVFCLSVFIQDRITRLEVNTSLLMLFCLAQLVGWFKRPAARR